MGWGHLWVSVWVSNPIGILLSSPPLGVGAPNLDSSSSFQGVCTPCLPSLTPFLDLFAFVLLLSPFWVKV